MFFGTVYCELRESTVGATRVYVLFDVIGRILD
jgi:hypothetical protein